MVKTPTFPLRTFKVRPSTGYTLAELLVVLMILGLLTAIAAPRITMGSDSSVMRTNTDHLVNLLRVAKVTARRTGQSTKVFIAPLDKTAWIEGQGQTLHLNENLSLEAVGADVEAEEETIGIRFFADGMSTGGEVKLGLNTLSRTIKVIWANGEVRLEQE